MSEEEGKRKRRPITLVSSVLLALAILYLAGPRTMAAVVMFPGNHLLKRVQSGEALSEEQLETLINSRERALVWVESGRVRTDLALAKLLLAQQRTVNQQPDEGLVDQAKAELRQGLLFSPARPHAWTRLAFSELQAGGDARQAVAALRMALRVAPYEPGVMFVRLEVGLRLWWSLDPELREQLGEQIRMAWRHSGEQLIATALKTRRVHVVRAALSRSPGDSAEFEKRLRQTEA